MAAERADPLPLKNRKYLSTMMAAVFAIAGAMLAAEPGRHGGSPFPMVVVVFVSIIGGLGGLLRASARFMPSLGSESRILRHLAMGTGACMGLLVTVAFWGHNWLGFPRAPASCLAIALSALLLNWEERVRPDRRERLVPLHLITAAAVSLFVGLLFEAEVPLVVATVCGISLVVSIRSPWLPPAARPAVPPAPPAAGAFTDRPVAPVTFTPQQTKEADMLSVTPPLGGPLSVHTAPKADAPGHRSGGIVRLIRALVRLPFFLTATALLLAALAAAIFLATDIPGLLASGRVDPSIPRDMARGFNTQAWPSVMRATAGATLFVTASLACVFHLLLRRRRGPVHMVRALGSIGLLLTTPFVVMRAGAQWGGPNFVLGREDWWQVMQSGFGTVRVHDVFLAVCLFVTSALLMLWPAARRELPAPPQAADAAATTAQLKV